MSEVLPQRSAGAPLVVVIAGPNGAGKSTSAPRLLRDALEVEEFVNADAIAAGLSAFRPESVALEAVRVMLRRIRSLAAARRSFAFETTLASQSFAPFLDRLRWDLLDQSDPDGPSLIASGSGLDRLDIVNPDSWKSLMEDS